MSTKSVWESLMAHVLKPEEKPVVSETDFEPELEPEPEETPVAIVSANGVLEIPEGRSFEDIYRSKDVPTSVYSAEKLLAFMDGLATMPPNQIRMVIAAMDAADATWTIQDPLSDATAKIAVLQAEKTNMTATVSQIEAQGKANTEALDTGLAESSTSIRQQIEALQVQLQEEISRVSAEKIAIETRNRAARDAATRESLRLDTEVTRLSRVPNIVGTGPAGGK